MIPPASSISITIALSPAAWTTYSPEPAIITMPAQVEINEGKILDFKNGFTVNAPASLNFETYVLERTVKDRLDATCGNNSKLTVQ